MSADKSLQLYQPKLRFSAEGFFGRRLSATWNPGPGVAKALQWRNVIAIILARRRCRSHGPFDFWTIHTCWFSFLCSLLHSSRSDDPGYWSYNRNINLHQTFPLKFQAFPVNFIPLFPSPGTRTGKKKPKPERGRRLGSVVAFGPSEDLKPRNPKPLNP